MRSSGSSGKLTGLSNYYTSLFGPVLDPGEPDVQGVLESLAAAVARDRGPWHAIDLRPLAVDAPEFSALAGALRKAGLAVQTYFCFGNWYARVGGRSYAQYFEGLPSQVKNTVTRKRKQLEKLKSRIVVCLGEAGLEEALEAYERIYAVSWKVPEPYPHFISGLCRNLRRAGLAASGYRVRRRAAGRRADLGRPRWDRIHLQARLRRALRQALGRIDPDRASDAARARHRQGARGRLPDGDDAYKKDWMSARRERWGMVAFNPRTPRGLLEAAWHFGTRATKQTLGAARRLVAPRT